jgi:2-polyprenyl-3-methyl-5-hydroxy-6-metoxy-1,4-benzoquinol methylase
MTQPFDAAVPAWTTSLDKTRNVVRQRLVEAQLLERLDGLPPGSAVLDVGCGQGTIAIALARRGFRVVGVDPSEELLARAREGVQGLDASFVVGTVDSLADVAPDRADVVCCHGVVMYLPELRPAVAALVDRARPGGIVSLLTRNQAGIAFRAGMMRRWDDVPASLDAAHYTNRVGVEDARADRPHEVAAACEAAGAEVIAWYGVRVFTDHWADVEPPADIDAIVRAEAAAGRRDLYRQIAALTHTVARRRDEAR